ncbi:MAG: nickel pincer cofactor biosynthesis protein LarC [bacterium]|nr:nickel pincer cofactor biosynthesis protein LarC [bacterium]
MKTIYIDAFSGISGDMMVGALIDLGLPLQAIKEGIDKLPLEGYEISCKRVKKNGIDAAKFSVEVKEKQPSRLYSNIREMLEESALKKEVRDLSLAIFDAIAVAEGKVHGIAAEKVHFHEVGAVDSIIDIVATAIGVDHLGIKKIVSSKIITGTGMVKGDHGHMPIPAPATAELLKGIPFKGSDAPFELATPTGAAIVKVLTTEFGDMPDINTQAIGYGAGERDLECRPNLLRIFLGEQINATVDISDEVYDRDNVLIMEASIDDMNPQFFEPLVEELFNCGALDVCMTPIFMKKMRPATLLQVIAPVEKRGRFSSIIFSGSTTIGIRCYEVERIKLIRREETVETSFGRIRVKVIEKRKGLTELRPEYEELKRLSLNSTLSIVEINSAISSELADKKI